MEIDTDCKCARVDLVADEEEDDDWASEVVLKEGLCDEVWTADGLFEMLVHVDV